MTFLIDNHLTFDLNNNIINLLNLEKNYAKRHRARRSKEYC